MNFIMRQLCPGDLALPFTSWVTLDRCGDLSEPQFHDLQHKDNNGTLSKSIYLRINFPNDQLIKWT